MVFVFVVIVAVYFKPQSLKQIKSIAGVKKVTSTSIQDFSSVVVEFNTNVDVPVAKQKVKDAVDRAKKDLPQDLPADPNVMEVEFSEMPILFVNIAGNSSLDELKKYADACLVSTTIFLVDSPFAVGGGCAG